MKPVLVIQNVEAERGDAIRQFLAQEGVPVHIVRTYLGEDLPAVTAVEAIITLGCPDSVNDYNSQLHTRVLYQYTANALRYDVPYLGICYGGQLIAKVLGAKVTQLTSKEIGLYPVCLTEAGLNDPVFAGFSRNLDVFEWHGDTFNIPFGATLLCEGNGCRNQAFRKGNAVALQFHFDASKSEVTEWCSVYAQELVEVSKTDKQVADEFLSAEKSLAAANRRLLRNFLKL